MEASPFKKTGSESESSGNSFVGGGREERGSCEYFGWVYHIGVNSIGHEYCHLRFLFIRRKYVELYKRDPHENPGIVRFFFFALFLFTFSLNVMLARLRCILNVYSICLVEVNCLLVTLPVIKVF